MIRHLLISLGMMSSLLIFDASAVFASGIFTLRGKLMSFTNEVYVIQTKTMAYEIKKSELSRAQVDELKMKKTGQDVDLVVSTESVAKVRELK